MTGHLATQRGAWRSAATASTVHLPPLLGSIYYHKVFQKQLCRPQWKEHIVDDCPIIHSAGRDWGGTLSAEPAEQVSQI
jgi:hypothetical protein